MQENTVIKTEIKINENPVSVWRWLFNERNIKTLVDFPVGAQLKSKDDGTYSGTVTLRNTVFETEIRPFEITMKASGRIFVIRIMQSEENTVAVMAAFAPEGKAHYFSEQCMRTTLWRLKSLLENKEDPEDYRNSTESIRTDTASAQSGSVRETVQTESRISPVKHGNPMISAILSLLLLAVFITGFLKVPAAVSGILNSEPGSSQSGVSEGVTLENALQLKPEMSESDVKKLLGTSGTKYRDGRVYSSPGFNKKRNPAGKIYVAFRSGKVDLVTFLNLTNCSVSSSIVETEPLYYGESIEDMETSLCSSLSMYRCMPVENGTVTEFHFGYADPYATFSPYINGEYKVIKNSTDESITCINYGKKDLSDPLEIGSLKGNPVEFQYSDYDEFLLDRTYFERSLLMLNRFSKGDLVAIYGQMTQYPGGGGLDFYKVESTETLNNNAGEIIQLWKMSFGLTSRGAFAIGSYVNMRLSSRENMLNGCAISKVAMGMTYREIRTYLPILPTAVLVNENGYLICYGKYLEKSAVSEQYEYILKFDLNNRVSGIYDNTGMNASGSQMTSDPNAQLSTDNG